ncbi:MAG: hypothetical protein A3C80_04505 [Candidatus Ryanbacteria bacterium RIFCSPHIGHO2_02_FULL_45_43]|uniref:Transmembrane protein n=1 Tax=Candidatus Ryanbacteria bacterium RIFCSPHIGHO2_01_45_13 TaxID=1802112 RepID=A0A1G2G0Y2_9BACT|nr:MAG: hypothetical protein A2718_04405 [Candidatus Ryanbacteria bacterium RIFCSPHIGHO2_01_FULL_44_130]OGZ43652.1 MAG: hypothetical protein A2W41_04895 [Candidatus Ryanbacteria bacterium RIFCSPHIGHO2_01_45_13]OGZ49135.1 MAG: hypothetical protein A3C80_04505 [Candidatus Ryanbacteria bacterium RIFCSPHIGHO2_02_FULL_45_43]OGZ50916.1 MAG: hypothetical protein A3E55_00575 [Candidatus Ryanbacteria bacterium RIFCSPHIGHO2_12_FULL_44_20]OGZ51395.1 MAG: hypothetical protein A3A17_00205 [Candidatus Ryanba
MPEEQLEFGFEGLGESGQLDISQRTLLLTEKNEAQDNARHMLNLRVGSLVFYITVLGTVIAFGWNNGYNELWACNTLPEKWLRWILILFFCVVLGSLFIVQRNLEHRYDSSWQYARDLEKMLGIRKGLHQRLEDAKFPIISVRNMVGLLGVLLFAGAIALAIVNGVQMLYASSINIGKECHSEVKLF